MPEPLRWGLQLLGVLVVYGCMFGGAVLVERAKRTSPRWRQRSAFERRVLARWPGFLVGSGLCTIGYFLLPR